MAGPMFYNGQLLFRDGMLAMAQACCCGDVVCGDCPFGTPTMGDPPAGATVVDTLYAHITPVEGCECLAGICVPLTWRSSGAWGEGTWQGTVPVDCLGLPEASRYITLMFGCCGAAIPGYPNSYFWLGSDDCTAGANPGVGPVCPQLSPPTVSSQPAEAGFRCRPYNVTFLNFPGLTCCGVMPATFNVVVNETAC